MGEHGKGMNRADVDLITPPAVVQSPQGKDGTQLLRLHEGVGEVKQLCVSMYCCLCKDGIKRKW